MTDFAAESKYKLIGFSYIRRHCDDINQKYNASIIFPKDIIFIIIEYLQNAFEWDPEKSTQGTIISNNNLSVRYEKHRNGTFFAKNVLSSDECNTANWEITIRDVGNYTTVCIST